MSWLDKIKGKIMAISTGEFVFGWGAAQQAVDLQNAKMQSQLAMQQAQMNTAVAQQQAAMNNAFNGYQQAVQRQAISRTLSAFNLNGNAEYTFEELNDEGSVYNMPLQTAVDLAINMFGSGWFKDEDTVKTLDENTDFLVKVMAKIYKAGRLKCETCRDFNLDRTITAWKILDEDNGNH